MKYLILVLFLTGCTDYPEFKERTKTKDFCVKLTEGKRASFILQCLKNTNPKSDEDPEDWMRICGEMAVETYCEQKKVIVTYKRDCNGCGWNQVKPGVLLNIEGIKK